MIRMTPLPLLPVLLVLGFTASNVAAQDDLPPADALIDMALDAMGGEERLRKIKSQSVYVSVQAGDVVVTIEVHSAMPDKLLMIEREQGERRMGANGDLTWAQNTIGTYALVEADAAQQMKDANIILQLLNMKKDFPVRKTLGTETVLGEPCYQVELSGKEDGRTRVVYFSVEHKRLTALDAPVHAQAPPRYVVFRDWKRIGAITHYMRQSVILKDSGATVADMKIDRVEFDKADPRMFDVPPEVMALAAEKAQGRKPGKKS